MHVRLLSIVLVGLGLAQSAGLGAPSKVQVHRLRSPYQAGPTTVRVLLPDTLEAGERYRVLYVLPVVAQDQRRFGDGLSEIRRHGWHNEFKLICVAPEFTAPPWLADHDGDPHRRDESHLLKVVLPFVEQNYPAQKVRAGRLLVGFSKSGWGALTLLLRNPEVFERAASWDPGVRVDTGPISEAERAARIARDFGSVKNFEQNRLSHLLRTSDGLGEQARLLLDATTGKRAQGCAELHQLMVRVGVAHHYRFEPRRKHRWDSGWMKRAVSFLALGELE